MASRSIGQPKCWSDEAIEGAKVGPAQEVVKQIGDGLLPRLLSRGGSLSFTPSMLQGVVDHGGEALDLIAMGLSDWAARFSRFESEGPNPHRRTAKFYSDQLGGWECPSPQKQLKQWIEIGRAMQWRSDAKPMLDRLSRPLPKLPSTAEMWIVTQIPSKKMEGGYWGLVNWLATKLQAAEIPGHRPDMRRSYPYDRFAAVLRDLREPLTECGGTFQPATAAALLEIHARNRYGDFVLIPVQMGKDWAGASLRHMLTNLRPDEFALDPLTALSLVTVQPDLFMGHWQSTAITFAGTSFRSKGGGEVALSIRTEYRRDHTRLELEPVESKVGGNLGHATGFKCFV